MKIKAVIFDWARTLYDVDNNIEFPDAINVLEYCKQKEYHLALVSLVASDESLSGTTLKTRNNQIYNSPLKKYFEKILITDSDKGMAIDEIKNYFGFESSEILIVDDRVSRGIKYGNQNGYQTAWLQKGTYANELPNSETGKPIFAIKFLKDLKNII